MMKRFAILAVAAVMLSGIFGAASAFGATLYGEVGTQKNGVDAFYTASPDTTCAPPSCTVYVDLNNRDLKRFKKAFNGTSTTVTIPGNSLAVQTYSVSVGGPWSMYIYAQWLEASNPFGQPIEVTVSVS